MKLNLAENEGQDIQESKRNKKKVEVIVIQRILR